MKALYRLIHYLICILFGVSLAFGQSQSRETDSINTKISDAQLLAHSDPTAGKKELIKLKKQSEKINYKEGAMRSSMTLVKIYYSDGDFEKSIEETRFVEKYAKELNHYEYLSDIYRMRAISYGEMGFVKEKLEELEKSLPFAEKIEKVDTRPYKKALIYESYAGLYVQQKNAEKEIFYRHKSIRETHKMLGKHPLVINAKFQNLAYQFAGLGLTFSNLNNTDSATYYFEEAYKITENNKYEIYTNMRATLYSNMAVFYGTNKNFLQSIAFAKRAENLEKQTPMPYIRRDIYHSLFNAYAETDQIDSSKYYLTLYTSLNDSLLKIEKESLMTPFKQIISDNKTDSKNTVRSIVAISALTLVVLILSGAIYLKRKNKNIHKKYEAIISKIKSETEIPLNNEEIILNSETEILGNHKEINEHSESKSTVGITDETLNLLISRLQKFEKSKLFLKKDLSRSWLTSHLNTNSKYLFDLIKNHKGKNFTDYINGLRIDYIIRLLIENPKYREYKNESLAEECGFNSRQVFINAFKKETGFTPSYFIENLKKDSESSTNYLEEI